MDTYARNPIRIPVTLVGGQWEYFYGGELPIRDGAVGDLVIEKDFIDKKFLSSLQRKTAHLILDVGTKLLVALTITHKEELDAKLKQYLKPINHPEIKRGYTVYGTRLSSQTQFVEIEIAGPTDKQKKNNPTENGGIWLNLEGTQPKGITTSRISIPNEVNDGLADSLNHAFTLLSEKYEPWRKSHTGNIYERVLYREKNQKWYPLKVLRHAAIAEEEHQLIRERWIEISKELNIPSDTNR